MDKPELRASDLDRRDLAKLAMDMFHRTLVHYVFWFKEVEHQMGFEKSLEVMSAVYEKNMSIQLSRIGKTFGFKLLEGIPEPLLNMSKAELETFVENLSLNWLAEDGIWFQAVEAKKGMLDAKRCNDSCWAWFSPFEAWSIKRFLNLPEYPGIEGLKEALQLRLYAKINVQTILDESPSSIVFKMNDCRVQSARKSKKLDNYPCKSAGLVEYTSFASAIDSRIRTECLGCPPDEHPEEWYCAWRFSID